MARTFRALYRRIAYSGLMFALVALAAG